MENNMKIGFFKRLKIAIFKLEEYGVFLGERLSKSLKYFCILVLIVTAATVLAGVYNFNKMINSGINYINNEMPDFSYSDGNLKFEQNVEAYDKEYGFKLYVNTDEEVSEEKINSYTRDIYSVGEGIVLLKDKFIYVMPSNTFEDSYAHLSETGDLKISNKEDLLKLIDTAGVSNIILVYSISNFISMYLINIITIFMDILLIAIFGHIASRLCGVRFKLSPILTLSIYATTLSIVLSGIYNVVYLLTGFVIKYFNVMYLLISYVYIIAAIFMIKYDLIKQNEELQKIIEVQKQVKKEAEEQDNESEEKDEKEKKKEEPPVEETPKEEENKEPDGSEI